jgi:hypothetical protein
LLHACYSFKLVAIVQSQVPFIPSTLNIKDTLRPITFEVKLDVPSSNDVTVCVDLNGGYQFNLSNCRLTFTAKNFNKPQKVTIVPALSNVSTTQEFTLQALTLRVRTKRGQV